MSGLETIHTALIDVVHDVHQYDTCIERKDYIVHALVRIKQQLQKVTEHEYGIHPSHRTLELLERTIRLTSEGYYTISDAINSTHYITEELNRL